MSSPDLLYVQFNKQQTYGREDCSYRDIHRCLGVIAAGDRAGTRARQAIHSASKEVTGEVVDMMCYVDHNAVGEKHGQSCGAKCVKSGGPVGIVSDGKAYLVVGEHKPMNDQLAEYCGKTITLKGKLAERGGIAMIENAEIVTK